MAQGARGVLLGSRPKGACLMHKATIVSLSKISGEHTLVIENDNLLLFLAEVTGSIQGITAAGSVITSLETKTAVPA
jgi:hypothetical protein